jgi:hypothetical protein
VITSILLSWILSQVPCTPSDSTVVCQCKQGIASACDVLADTDSELYKQIARAWAMSKAAQESGKANALVDVGCGQPPDDGGKEKKECTGQEHHVISKKVWAALEATANLKGKFTYRDPRYVTRAVDEKAHCGWWGWHKQLDEEIAKWISDRPALTTEQFLTYLRQVYARPELLARFPNGF